MKGSCYVCDSEDPAIHPRGSQVGDADERPGDTCYTYAHTRTHANKQERSDRAVGGDHPEDERIDREGGLEMLQLEDKDNPPYTSKPMCVFVCVCVSVCLCVCVYYSQLGTAAERLWSGVSYWPLSPQCLRLASRWPTPPHHYPNGNRCLSVFASTERGVVPISPLL